MQDNFCVCLSASIKQCTAGWGNTHKAHTHTNKPFNTNEQMWKHAEYAYFVDMFFILTILHFWGFSLIFFP